MEASASHSVRAASTVEAPVTTTGEAAVGGMPRPAVDAVIDVVVVVSFIMPVPPITMVIPIMKVTIVVKIMVAVAEEKNRREAHVKR